MRLLPPYNTKYHISQTFAQNKNDFYKNDGLIGHTGWDFVGVHKSPIIAAIDSYCYSIANPNNKDLMRYRAVYTLVEDRGIWYEVSYGHLWDILVESATHLKQGQQIGTQGNTGRCSSNGKEVTVKEKENGSGKGSHLHFQVRLVKPVDKKEKGKEYLYGQHGILKYNNKYFEVPFYKNGVKGCVDPAQFFTLRYGMEGVHVWELQKRLGIIKDGMFGIKTEQAVKDFQKKKGLVVDGLVGPATLSALTKL